MAAKGRLERENHDVRLAMMRAEQQEQRVLYVLAPALELLPAVTLEHVCPVGHFDADPSAFALLDFLLERRVLAERQVQLLELFAVLSANVHAAFVVRARSTQWP